MGSCPVIPHPFSPLVVLTVSAQTFSPFSWPQHQGEGCTLGCGPEVCGQGRLALHSSGPISPSMGWRGWRGMGPDSWVLMGLGKL